METNTAIVYMRHIYLFIYTYVYTNAHVHMTNRLWCEDCTMHLGTLWGLKIMKTLGEITCVKDLPLFATIAM